MKMVTDGDREHNGLLNAAAVHCQTLSN